MAGVTASYNYRSSVLALRGQSACEFRGVDEAGSGEGRQTFEVGREIGFAAVASSLDYMLLLLVTDALEG